jgi:hypothetical protein
VCDTSSGHCNMLVALRDRSGGGSDVQCHHANTGSGGSAVRRLRLEHRGKLCGGSGWKPFVVGYGLIQHAMKEVNPRIRMRLRHPKELTLHFLNRVLFHIRQNDQQFVRHRRQGTIVIRTVTSAGTGLAINGAVLQLGRSRALNM